jgi:hypothetical protein
LSVGYALEIVPSVLSCTKYEAGIDLVLREAVDQMGVMSLQLVDRLDAIVRQLELVLLERGLIT